MGNPLPLTPNCEGSLGKTGERAMTQQSPKQKPSDNEQEKKQKQQEKEQNQKQQSQKTYYTTITALIKSKEPRATMKKKLPYRNWILYVYRNQERFWIKLVTFKKGKIITILNIYPNDIKYITELLQEIENVFKQNGIKFTQL